MSTKFGGLFLDSMSNVLVAIAAVASVWLLLRDMGYTGLTLNKQGFAADGSSGASMRFDGLRSDGYSDSTTLVVSPSAPAKQGFLGALEPPVFWNAGSMSAIATAQAQGIANESLDDGSAFDMSLGTVDTSMNAKPASSDINFGTSVSGFASKLDYAGRPVYNGFASRRTPVYQGFAAPPGGAFGTITRDGATKVLTGY